jgi:hypothetical protein
MIFRLLVDEQLSAYQINERLYESGIRTRHGKERWSSGFGKAAWPLSASSYGPTP